MGNTKNHDPEFTAVVAGQRVRYPEKEPIGPGRHDDRSDHASRCLSIADKKRLVHSRLQHGYCFRRAEEVCRRRLPFREVFEEADQRPMMSGHFSEASVARTSAECQLHAGPVRPAKPRATVTFGW